MLSLNELAWQLSALIKVKGGAYNCFSKQVRKFLYEGGKPRGIIIYRSKEQNL